MPRRCSKQVRMKLSPSLSLSQAWHRTGKILFQSPFNLNKWVALGFCAWLASISIGGYNFSKNFNGSSENSFPKTTVQNNASTNPIYTSVTKVNGVLQSSNSVVWHQVATNGSNANVISSTHYSAVQNGKTSDKNDDAFFNLVTYLMNGAGLMIVLLLVGVILVIITLWTALVLWLGARGRMMFLDNVLHNQHAIHEPWKKFSKPANAIFQFNFLIKISLIITAIFFGVMVFLFCWHSNQGSFWNHFIYNAELQTILLSAFFLYFPIGISLFFLDDFLVPVIYKIGCTPIEAAKCVGRIVWDNPLEAFIYVFLRSAMELIFLMITLTLGCSTCCLGFLPYIGTVVTLPFHVFRQSFIVDSLGQLDPQYQIDFANI